LESLRLIADIIRFVLTLFVHEEGADYRLLAAILDCSQNLYYQNNRRKQTIASYLVDHGIWSDTGAWRECIEVTLKHKMDESALRMKRRASQRSGSTTAAAKRSASAAREKESAKIAGERAKAAGAAFKKGFGKLNGKLKGLMQSKEQKFNEEAAKHSNLIFNELSKFVLHFCHMALPFDQATELLIYFCNVYQMEKSKMHILLTELQSNQKITSRMFSEKEMVTCSLLKRSNRLQKFGFTDITLILGISIRFVDSDRVLRNIICLSKDLNETLREEALK
jgi:hypothetical protein